MIYFHHLPKYRYISNESVPNREFKIPSQQFVNVLYTQVSVHGYVKSENLSPIQILDNEHEASHHIGMDEQSNIVREPSEGKSTQPTIDDDIIQDDAETNMLDQQQVNQTYFNATNLFSNQTFNCITLDIKK